MSGVTTEKPSTITDDLELLTRTIEPDAGALEALVRYAGAEESYTVSGSPLATLAGGEDHRPLRKAALVWLTTPGLVEGINELPVDLQR